MYYRLLSVPDFSITDHGAVRKWLRSVLLLCGAVFPDLPVLNLQPMSSTFFSSIGKPKKGTFLSLTRQIIFLLPLLVILPLFLGIDGIMYAGPIADCLAAVISGIFLAGELKKMGAEAER